MTQQVKRIDPYWHSHPMIPTGVAVGAILILIGYLKVKLVVSAAGAIIAALAIVFAARPVLSAVLGTMGLAGGVLSFLIMPSMGTADMSLSLKLVATLMFAVFYMVLADALVLIVAVFYNFYSAALGMRGVTVELEAEEDGSAADSAAG